MSSRICIQNNSCKILPQIAPDEDRKVYVNDSLVATDFFIRWARFLVL